MKSYNITLHKSGTEILLKDLDDAISVYRNFDTIYRCRSGFEGKSYDWQELILVDNQPLWKDARSVPRRWDLTEVSSVTPKPFENGVYFNTRDTSILYRRINGKWYTLTYVDGEDPYWQLSGHTDSWYVDRAVKIPRRGDREPMDLEYREGGTVLSPFATPWEGPEAQRPLTSEDVDKSLRAGVTTEEEFKEYLAKADIRELSAETITPNVPVGATVLGGPQPWENR